MYALLITIIVVCAVLMAWLVILERRNMDRNDLVGREQAKPETKKQEPGMWRLALVYDRVRRQPLLQLRATVR